MNIIGNGRRYTEFMYGNEKEFEDDVISSSKNLFGENTIYINAKKKIESKALGGAVPDGFFFDFGDATDPQFYIVEIELSEHSFFNHIFPQITKFFAFFKNPKLQKSLVEKIFSIINTDDALRNEFRKYLGQTEIFKFLSDIIESSQNILLVVDGSITELPEIMDTYTDTWGKMVRHMEIKKYVNGEDTVYTIHPDFETLQYIESTEVSAPEVDSSASSEYTEEYHLEGVNPVVKDIYSRIKTLAAEIDPNLIFNPQKYYISIRAGKNIAFLKIRNKKIRIVAMMPEEQIRRSVRSYSVSSLSEPVQKFYNGPCAVVDVTNFDHLGEIKELTRRVVEFNKNN